MLTRIVVIAAATVAASAASASHRDDISTTTRPSYQARPEMWDQPAPVVPRHHRHRFARRRYDQDTAARGGSAREDEIARLRSDLAAVRKELDAVRARVGPAWPSGPLAGLPALPRLFDGLVGVQTPSDPVLASLPDLRGPAQPPSLPVPLAPQGPSEDVAVVGDARAYLIKTATIGYTMQMQTPEVAIGRLHPAFAVKLAQAIKLARSRGLEHCGVFSAYRPPAFGVGGFSNKFNSLHSYGLAADVAGIGSAGSAAARLWQKIVKEVGLFLPYGSNNRAEWNHTQLLPTKVANAHLRKTITARAPKSLAEMWMASGVPNYVAAGELHAPPAPTASVLPSNDY